MRYVSMGQVPPKRHTQFRENGTLLTEEVMGYEGFSGNESILYHLQSPCRVSEVGEFTPRTLEEWVPDAHTHRLTHTTGVEAGGDTVFGRRVLMFNSDVEMAIAKPTEEVDAFYRNGEGDEVLFVHEGEGEVETIFGTLPFRELDVLGVSTCSAEDFAEAVTLVARRRAWVAPLITHEYALEEAPAAIAFAIDNPEDAMKVLVRAG